MDVWTHGCACLAAVWPSAFCSTALCSFFRKGHYEQWFARLPHDRGLPVPNTMNICATRSYLKQIGLQAHLHSSPFCSLHAFYARVSLPFHALSVIWVLVHLLSLLTSSLVASSYQAPTSPLIFYNAPSSCLYVFEAFLQI